MGLSQRAQLSSNNVSSIVAAAHEHRAFRSQLKQKREPLAGSTKLREREMLSQGGSGTQTLFLLSVVDATSPVKSASEGIDQADDGQGVETPQLHGTG